jgi:hypothetical protein
MSQSIPGADHPLDAIALGAVTWLACGGVLAGLTPLPIHDATAGWSPAFWLLAAPLIVLCARRLTRSREERQPRRSPRFRPESRVGARAPRPHGPLRRHAATPRRLASIRRRNSCMMRR